MSDVLVHNIDGCDICGSTKPHTHPIEEIQFFLATVALNWIGCNEEYSQEEKN